jgi:hypothetical protein
MSTPMRREHMFVRGAHFAAKKRRGTLIVAYVGWGLAIEKILIYLPCSQRKTRGEENLEDSPEGG